MRASMENRFRKPLTMSVCIATHERAGLLAGTLDGLSRQTRPPDEVIISDSSSAPESGDVVAAFAARHSSLRVRYVPCSRKALPWQRWWAFQHSSGEVVLFLDDDVTLAPPALDALERAYASLPAALGEPVAGIGFWITYEDGTRLPRDTSSLRERWLGISRLRSGCLSSGGLAVSLAGIDEDEPVEVDVLWGGAMSFRREALTAMPLHNLVSLYEAGIGRGEDSVLSFYARRVGKLFVLNESLAVHPYEPPEVATPYARDGWRLGLTHTFGRAHTMRWMASDWSAYKTDWFRFVTYDLFRGLGAVLVRPWSGKTWLRLAGACYGIGLSLVEWKRIPSSARSDVEPPEVSRASSEDQRSPRERTVRAGKRGRHRK